MTSPPPVSSASQHARAFWSPVTVRVCWDLLSAGVNPRPHVVADAREHVLRSLPPHVHVDDVDWAASALTRDFLRRARGGVYEEVSLASWPRCLSRVDTQRLQDAAGPLGEVLFRVHYGDGQRIRVVAAQAAVDESSLRAARSGLREITRALLAEVLDEALGWADGRVDDALRYLAHRPERGCPGPVGLLSEAGRTHADRCPRCSRAVRLVKGGVLAPSDLFPPEEGLPGEDTLDLVALLLHPDARPHRGTVARALEGLAVEVDGLGWLLDGRDLEAVHAALSPLARTGSPSRELLRSARVRGPGRWRTNVVLGDLPIDALAAARARPWGELDGLDDLPVALPPPPSAVWFWAAALVLLGLTMAMGREALQAPPIVPTVALEASFAPLEDGWLTRFDVDELASVSVVYEEAGKLHAVALDQVIGKAAWATGEGDYLLTVPGEAAAVVVSVDDAVDVGVVVESLVRAGRGMEALEATLLGASADVHLARSPGLVPQNPVLGT